MDTLYPLRGDPELDRWPRRRAVLFLAQLLTSCGPGDCPGPSALITGMRS